MRLLLAAALTLTGVNSLLAQSPERKLNVLFLMSDDMRPDLGCYGHATVKSPHLDSLAASGVRFDRAYCQYPLCNPSRQSLLTGRHPTTTGVLDNTAFFRDRNPDWVTLPQHFKNNGYTTLRTGKIFHGGIDDVESWTEGGEPRATDGRKKPDPKVRARRSDQRVVLEGDGQSHGDYRTAEQAIAYLQKYQDEPFFLACGFTKPHSPPTAPQTFYDLYHPAKIDLPVNFVPRPTAPEGFPKASVTGNGDLFINRDANEEEARLMRQAYWASISWTDWNVGRVLAEFDRLGLREQTVIVFWGDHGYHLGERGKWAKHGSLFEMGTRVPLIIAVPGNGSKGQAAAAPVQTLDIYPTLCELCGLSLPEGLEGHSLTPLLNDIGAEWPHPAYSVAGNRNNLGVAVRTQTYRYAEWNGGEGGAMLFDEGADPDELKNLAGDPAHAAAQKELQNLARRHAAPLRN